MNSLKTILFSIFVFLLAANAEAIQVINNGTTQYNLTIQGTQYSWAPSATLTFPDTINQAVRTAISPFTDLAVTVNDESTSKKDLLLDGTRAMTGALNMGSQAVNLMAHGVLDTDGVNQGDVKTLIAARIIKVTCGAGSGGAATEALTCTGLASTDTILAVTQSVKGANSLPLLGYNTLITNGLTGVWSANPGASSVLVVTVLR